MKIAIVSRGFSVYRGGAERFTNCFCNELLQHGHEVHLFSGETLKNIPEQIILHEIKFTKIFSFLKLLSFHFSIRKELKKEKFDIIYGLCQFFPLDFYYAGGGVYKHWMMIRYPLKLFRWFKYIFSPSHMIMLWLERGIYKNKNSQIITNSKLVKKHILKYYAFSENRIKVIYDGIDHNVFNTDITNSRKSLREEYGYTDKDFVILFIANNWSRKGLMTILNALASLPKQYKLVVGGKGNSRKYIKISNLLNIASNRVKFIGVLSDIAKIYGIADVFVLPTMYDPFAQVCKEAMACGLPVITTLSNGASEIIINGENGYILQKWDDYKALSQLLQKIYNSTSSDKFRINALDAVKQYNWKKNVEDHLDYFEKSC
ncbi:hypothetical protein BVX93_02075 [bacterium B13(2017)]|nr:hypothetical protein BVX93_02075 [bacterium B13(2017)]